MGQNVPATAVAAGVVSSQVDALRNVFGSAKAPAGFAPNGQILGDILAMATIAIVDDQPINIKIIQKHLKMVGYQRFVTTTEARDALELIGRERPDVVLLDIMMPYVSGLDILATLRKSQQIADVPVIILTAASDRQTKLDALALGANEFLQKPIDTAELEARLKNVLAVKAHQDRLKTHATDLEAEVAARSAELIRAHREVVRCLAVVGEYRDNETGKHTVRVGRYAEIIARFLGMGPEFTDRIRDAAPLHDIGKVGIPDAILLKPGKLETAEFDLMKRHSEFGRLMCSGQLDLRQTTFASHTAIGQAIADIGESPILRMAGSLAHTHHERWDGNGYPQRLKGEEIPIEGRITAVADVFDALTSHRPYKPAFPVERSLDIIRQESGKQFDPQVVTAFFAGLEQILATHYECADIGPSGNHGEPVETQGEETQT